MASHNFADRSGFQSTVLYQQDKTASCNLELNAYYGFQINFIQIMENIHSILGMQDVLNMNDVADDREG